MLTAFYQLALVLSAMAMTPREPEVAVVGIDPADPTRDLFLPEKGSVAFYDAAADVVFEDLYEDGVFVDAVTWNDLYDDLNVPEVREARIPTPTKFPWRNTQAPPEIQAVIIERAVERRARVAQRHLREVAAGGWR